MIKYLTFIITILITTYGFAQKTLDELLNTYNTRSIPYVSVEELRMRQLNDNVIILDAREIDEYNVSHIQGAKLVGFNNFSSDKISEEIVDKNTPIIVYCSLGIRSEEIGEKLCKAGFTNVKNLYGGIFEWRNKDFPVLDSVEKETDSIHTFSKLWSKWLLKGVKVYKVDLEN